MKQLVTGANFSHTYIHVPNHCWKLSTYIQSNHNNEMVPPGIVNLKHINNLAYYLVIINWYELSFFSDCGICKESAILIA